MIGRLLIFLVGSALASAQTSSVWHVRDSGVTSNLLGVATGTIDGGAGVQVPRVVAVGEAGTIVYSDDDGLTWVHSSSGTTASLTAVCYDPPTSSFFAVGGGGLILRSNDAIEWVGEASPVTTRLNGVSSGSNGTVLAVGDAGTGLLTRDSSGAWTRSDPGFGDRWMRGVSGSRIVGQGGAMFELSETAWSAIETGVTMDLEAVGDGVPSFASGSANLAVGTMGTILFRLGLPGWAVSPSGTTERLRAVRSKQGALVMLITLRLVVPVGEFFAVGTHGTILRSADGTNWKSDRSPTARDLNGIATSRNTTIVVGDGGTILRTGGVTALPMFTQQPVRGTDAEGRPYIEATVEGEGAISYRWVRLGGGAPTPIGSDYPRQVLPSADTSTSYALIAANAFGVFRSDQPAASRFLNLSARARVGAGENVLIGGFAMRGAQRDRERTFLIRAVGPALIEQGVTRPLAAPVLTLFRGQTAIATNRGWETASNASEISSAAARVQTFPLRPGAADSALLVSLPEGTYTAHVESGDGGEGIALLEIYDTESPNLEHLTNVSARARVGSGEAVLIGGLVLEGGRQKKVLLRAAGPALSIQGIQSPLPQPQLRLYRGESLLTRADAWSAAADPQALRIAALAAGAFGFSEGSMDAAIVTDLEPGAHTVVVDDLGGSEGVALVEIYEHP